MKKRNINPKGFTLIELVVTAVIAVIFILGIGYTLVDNHRSWHAMFNRVYSEVITEGHVARRMFDVFVRKSGAKNILLDENGSWVEVYYYGSPASTQLDRYARFYQSGDKLDLECGIWYPGEINPKIMLNTRTVCSNVSSCVFTRIGPSVQMVLKLDNGPQTATVMSSAVAHN